MDTGKLIKIIIAVVSVIFIITVILLVVLLTNNKEQANQEDPNQGFSEEEIAKDNIFDEDSIEQFDFMIVSNCVSSYLAGINQTNLRYYTRDENDNLVLDQEQLNQGAYDMLSREYIEKNEIAVQNVYEYVPEIKQELLFTPVEMKVEKAENINSYLVYGLAADLDYNPIGYFYTIINLDKYNRTFSVEPIDKSTYEDGTIQNNNISIEANTNNTYSYQGFTEDTAVQQYFKNYKIMMLSNPELAYRFLDEAYRSKAFGSVEYFKEYINKKREYIITATPRAYGITTNGDYSEYVEKDASEKYYIFNISNKNAADYKVMLDTYVIGRTEFNEEYEKSDDRKKVISNSMRFIYAINDQNYYYAYSVLDDTFKQNNFGNIEEFENFVRSHFFEYNEIASSFEFRQEGNYFVYDTQLRSSGNSTAESKNISIIMQLKEGTDFVMSFNVE